MRIQPTRSNAAVLLRFFTNSSDIQFNTNFVCIGDVYCGGNIAPTNLNGIAIGNYLTTTSLTDGSITDIVTTNIGFSYLSDLRLNFTSDETNFNTPVRFVFRVNSTEVGTWDSNNLTLQGGLTGYYTSAQTDSAITAGLSSYYTSTYINSNYYTSAQIDNSNYTKTETDNLLDGKQDTSNSLTNLLATALCQYSGHVTINEIQGSEPSESLRVSGDTRLGGALEVTGTTSCNSNLTVSNNLTVNNDFYYNGVKQAGNIFCGGLIAGAGVKVNTFGRVSFFR